MAWSERDIPRLDGQTAVVTGANGGLGLETARALARHGATVVMAARNPAKTEAAVAAIEAETPGAKLDVVPLDLGSLESVRQAAATVLARHSRIDMLVNNAGLMALPEQATADGFEMQFGVNHLGHFVWTARLFPAVAAAAGRIVTVTSTAHHMGRPVDPANPHLHGRYGPWKAYGQSKLANYYFGLGLHQRLRSAGSAMSSLLAHPGLAKTDLQTHSASERGDGHGLIVSITDRIGMGAADGALPQIRAATDPSAKSGQFYGPRYVNNGPPVVRPVLRRWKLAEHIESLWDVSERETGEVFDIPAQVADSRK